MAEKKTQAVAEPVDNIKELEALRAELAKYKEAEAKKQAEADAEVAREKSMEEMIALDVANQAKSMQEKVPVYLIKDNNEYKTDVEVCWNGKIFQIKRGMQVLVPRGVEQILKQSAHQDMIAMKKMGEFENVDLGER